LETFGVWVAEEERIDAAIIVVVCQHGEGVRQVL
jgi:hypothetical protein